MPQYAWKRGSDEHAGQREDEDEVSHAATTFHDRRVCIHIPVEYRAKSCSISRRVSEHLPELGHRFRVLCGAL